VESSEKKFNSRLSTLYVQPDLFIFFVRRMATATTAKLFEFEPFGRRFLVFRRYVVAFFALSTL
jgi:hypothetical protein